MKIVNHPCVFVEPNNGHPVIRLRIRKKKLKVSMNFPFTERGEEMAIKAYEEKIKHFNELYTT